MKYTLLDLVQIVLSSLDADQVNSISDTLEAYQVAQIVRTCYDQIVSTAGLPEEKDLCQLTAVGPDCPVRLVKPEVLEDIEWFKYNCRRKETDPDNWTLLKYLSPLDFLELTQKFPAVTASPASIGSFVIGVSAIEESVLTKVEWSVKGGDVPVYFKNDTPPTYYTSFDDKNIFCDAYVKDLETNLQSINTLCWGQVASEFLFEDTFVPSLDSNLFSLLISEAKATAWAEMKQSVNQRAEKKSRTGWVRLQKNKQNIGRTSPFYENLPNYGRNYNAVSNDILKLSKRNS